MRAINLRQRREEYEAEREHAGAPADQILGVWHYAENTYESRHLYAIGGYCVGYGRGVDRYSVEPGDYCSNA